MALERKIKWLFGLIILANIIIVLVVALGAFEPPPPKPLPNPNGYDDFVKAGNLLSGKAGDCSTMTQTELAALVATNAEPLKLLRIGLNHECLVPNNHLSRYATNYLTELSSQKELALNLGAEGRLAETQNRTNDAAQSYLDAMSFGIQCSQGGIMISKLSGIGCEYFGRVHLQSLTNGVNSQQCRKIVRTLETLDAKEDPVDFFVKRDDDLMRKNASLRKKIEMFINYKDYRYLAARFADKIRTNQLHRRQIIIDFAARAYQLEKGKPPTAIANLVPDYLKAIPKDPVTGSNLVLRVSAP